MKSSCICSCGEKEEALKMLALWAWRSEPSGGIPPFGFAVCFSIGAVAFSRSFSFPAPGKAARRTYFEFEYSAIPRSDSCPNKKRAVPNALKSAFWTVLSASEISEAGTVVSAVPRMHPPLFFYGNIAVKAPLPVAFPVSSAQGQPPRRSPASVRRRRPGGLGAVRETDRKPRRRFRSSAPPRHPTEAVLF